ncbi:FidL-like putative membrane protein [Grimontella sp. AG753]|nr:FidL-like putative membrane protein [Grimontella sp. AG753]
MLKNWNGYVIIAMIFFFTSIIFLFLYFSYKERFFTCTANVIFSVEKENTNIEVSGVYSIIVNDMKNASLTINGKLRFNDKTSYLNREYDMSMTHEKGSYYKILINNKNINNNDNTDSNIFEKYFLPQNEGRNFYTNIYKVKDNLFVVRGLSTPYLACLSY